MVENETGLRIVRLAVTDFKRLRAVDVSPPAGAVVVSGANGAGKSSLLDAILGAFGGKRLCPPRPVRIGAERAEIVVDLGDLEVLRTFAADGETRVRVRSKDGAEYRSPQAMLDAMTGPFLDPLAFTRLSPAEQRKALLDVLDLEGFDLAASEDRERGACQDRLALKRDLARVAAERDGIGLPPDLPPQAPDVRRTIDALGAAQATAARVQAARREAEVALGRAVELDRAIEEVVRRADARVETARRALAGAERDRVEEIARATQAAGEAARRARDLEREVADSVEPDLAAVQKAVEEAREVEAAVRRRDRWRELDAKAEATEREVLALDAKVDAERAARSEALEKAGIPVDGLTVVDGGLEFRGVPFAQASQSEQLRVAVALAMSRQPRLRVLRVQEAAVLDTEHLGILREEAEKAGWQIWLERVDPTGADLVIEDGRAVEQVAP